MQAEASQKNPRLFVTDCEGPISKNDNAFELTSSLVPDGDSFFALVSKYDDVLADVVKKPGYKAGKDKRFFRQKRSAGSRRQGHAHFRQEAYALLYCQHQLRAVYLFPVQPDWFSF